MTDDEEARALAELTEKIMDAVDDQKGGLIALALGYAAGCCAQASGDPETFFDVLDQGIEMGEKSEDNPIVPDKSGAPN